MINKYCKWLYEEGKKEKESKLHGKIKFKNNAQGKNERDCDNIGKKGNRESCSS